MDTGTKIGALAAGALIVFGEQTALREKIGAAEQQVRDANARQDSRKMELDKALAQLAAQKRKVQTPAEVIEALPGVLPLPKAIRVDQALLSPSAANSARQSQQAKTGQAIDG